MDTHKLVTGGLNQAQGRHYKLASRMAKTPKSFIREILKVTANPEIISLPEGSRTLRSSMLKGSGRLLQLC